MTDDQIGPTGPAAPGRTGADTTVCRTHADDPEVVALRRSVARLHRELAGYRVELPDRGIADEELASLADAADAADTGGLEPGRLRQSLLVVAGALGSVSALSGALAEVRRAIDDCTLPLDGVGR